MDPTFQKWYFSRAVWGGIVSIVCGLLLFCGVAISYEQQEQIISGFIAVSQFVASLSTIIAGALAIWGRIRGYNPIDTKANRAISANPVDCRIGPCDPPLKPEYIARVDRFIGSTDNKPQGGKPKLQRKLDP